MGSEPVNAPGTAQGHWGFLGDKGRFGARWDVAEARELPESPVCAAGSVRCLLRGG